MADLTDLLAEDATQFLVESNRAQLAQQDTLKKAQEKTAEIGGIYRDVAKAAGVASLTKSAADMFVQNEVAKAGVAAGLNPSQDMDRLYQTITQIHYKTDEVRSNLAEVRTKREMPIWENPIQWAINQVTLPFSEEKLQGSTQELDLAQKTLGQINNTLSVAQSVAQKQAVSVTAASAEALAVVAAGEAEIQARRAELDGLMYNSKAIQAGIEGPKERLGAVYDLTNAQRQADLYLLNLQKFKREGEQQDWARSQREAELEAKRENKKVDEHFAETIVQGDAVLGMPPRSAVELKSAVALLKTGQSKDLAKIYDIGRRYKASGVPIIGTTPSETLDNLTELPNNVAPIRTEALALIKQAREQILVDPKIDKKDGKAIANATDKLVEQFITGQLQSISPGSNNIFDIGDLSNYLGNKTGTGMTDLRATPLAEKILLPAIAAGQPLNDPRIVMGLTAKAINDGTITTTQAIDGLTFMYRKANLINQSALNLQGMGIVLPANGMMYNARMGGFFAKPVDMTSPEAVGRFLAKDLAERIQQTTSAFRTPAGQRSGGFPTTKFGTQE